MNIVVYVTFLAKKSNSNFIVETFFPTLDQFSQHRLFVITDEGTQHSFGSNFTVSKIRPQPGNSFLKKLWVERTLVNALRSLKADIFISTDNFCSLKAAIPQCVLVNEPATLKLAYAKKANCLIVPNEETKRELISRFDLLPKKISVLYPFPADFCEHVDFVMRESIKDKYTQGKEYFISPSGFKTEDSFRSLLKAYSHFKKRQQSSFKLMIISDGRLPFEKIIDNYKYKDDVVIVCSTNSSEKAKVMATAYAVILVAENGGDIQTAVNSMRCNVPLIAADNSPIKEVAKEAGLYVENDSIGIGEKMMLLYKDESLRYTMVQKGKELVENYSVTASANQLQVCIAKAMN